LQDPLAAGERIDSLGIDERFGVDISRGFPGRFSAKLSISPSPGDC
jgi:hypothetical protein